jgi:6-pyruvoyltetrahydropterin/6-carboxytetrahydropterin synthase
MFRLSRVVRFAVNDGENSGSPTAANGFGGSPPMRGLGHFFSLEATLEAELDPRTGYLRNIKEIDRAVRERVLPPAQTAAGKGAGEGGANLLLEAFGALKDAWPGCGLHRLKLWLTPFLNLEILAREHPMVRFNQKFEFCASHRLNNPSVSESRNRELFGKCNNPHGHGHNYVLQVTAAGEADANGRVVNVAALERIVASQVIESFDHKNLNLEVAEFGEMNPSVENIAKVIYGRLKPKLEAEKMKLAAVTVWETEKTCCEYSE